MPYFSSRMLTLNAHAKINLGLRVLHKRDDGYHNIETVFHRIRLADEVHLSAADEITMTCDVPEIPTDGRNLCMQAALELRAHSATSAGAAIHLTKRIPAGGGLGGGSSDAAATLLGLRRLWNLSVSDKDLRAIALRLGSDVPYFLNAGTAYATGRGEELEYFRLELPYWIVVAFPGIFVSTPWAYANLEIPIRKDPSSLKEALSAYILDAGQLRTCLTNDFEPVVFPRHPEIGRLKKTFYDKSAVFAQMSGSGSAVYAFFDTENSAREISGSLGIPVSITPPG